MNSDVQISPKVREILSYYWASQVVLGVKNLPANARDLRDAGESLGWEDPLVVGMASQYSCLESSMDRGAWRAIVHKAAKSQQN